MNDIDVLRRLAEQQARIAALPVHREKAEMWRKLNQLEPVRPMVWINEIPWHEMDVNGELTLQTRAPWAREIETQLRRRIYQWDHMPADMVVDDYLSCPPVIHGAFSGSPTGAAASIAFGITEDVDIVQTDEANDVVSRRFHRQISQPEDIEKIRMPQVTYDEAATEMHYQRMCDVFGDVMPVRKVGIKYLWFAPWDELIRWWGVEEAMIDLIQRPQMVNDIVARLVEAYLSELDQLEALNLLSLNQDNTRIGSGGYGYTGELPGPDFDPDHVRPGNMWGCATAQIFSSVSPEMHWEFAIRHEMRWLERFGLTYYGCCEPLDNKMACLKRIPNLRKISMSPWANVARGAALIGTDYVFSRKPSPALFAEDRWSPERARQELREALTQAQGCRIEVIMKDISTVRYEPQRLWEWERIAMETVEDFAP
jgi:hypothetical protein